MSMMSELSNYRRLEGKRRIAPAALASKTS